METRHRIGIIGMGHLGITLAEGWLRCGFVRPGELVVTRSRALAGHDLPVTLVDEPRSVVHAAEQIIITVRPQQFAALAPTIRNLASRRQTLITCMAGIHTDTVAAALSDAPVAVVRAMPNLPFKFGQGVTGLFAGSHADAVKLNAARELFDAGGSHTVVVEDEALMDVVTAVSGSGPAYFYYFVEALTHAAHKFGLPLEAARALATATCAGAGVTLLNDTAMPSELRKSITSAGGTTEAATRVLEQADVVSAMLAAVGAAVQRGRELGELNTAHIDAGAA